MKIRIWRFGIKFSGRQPAPPITGQRMSWSVFETRPLFRRRLGYVNAKSADEAMDKAAAKYPGRRDLAA